MIEMAGLAPTPFAGMILAGNYKLHGVVVVAYDSCKVMVPHPLATVSVCLYPTA